MRGGSHGKICRDVLKNFSHQSSLAYVDNISLLPNLLPSISFILIPTVSSAYHCLWITLRFNGGYPSKLAIQTHPNSDLIRTSVPHRRPSYSRHCSIRSTAVHHNLDSIFQDRYQDAGCLKPTALLVHILKHTKIYFQYLSRKLKRLIVQIVPILCMHQRIS